MDVWEYFIEIYEKNYNYNLFYSLYIVFLLILKIQFFMFY